MALTWVATGAAGCEQGAVAPAIVPLGGETMGTTWNVRYVGDPSPGAVHATRRAIEAVLGEVDAIFSTWNPASEISRLNAGSPVGRREVSAEFGRVLALSLDIATATDGAYDPTARPLLQLFGFTGGAEHRMPDAGEVEAALARVGYRDVHCGPEDGRWYLTVDAAPRTLELSSIAKGWGVERVSRALSALGLTDHFVEIGGEVQAAGRKPGGVDWLVGIERPPEPGHEASVLREAMLAVPLRDRAIATSGSYRNFVEAGGRRTHHVVDARTGRNPAHATVSVSVLAPGCGLADGLATALLVVGPAGARDVLARFGTVGSDVAALFLVADGPGGAIRTVEIGWPQLAGD
ncbi:MAG: FAD:protein FMN transferase [Planctomycetes bacterium]|nr:FAD:protein FMN transferase [Planctomycetota bacterium]